MIYEGELITYSYNKLWSELSDKDKLIIKAMVTLSPDAPIDRKNLMEQVGLSSAMMNRYQARLKEKGILVPTDRSYGKYSLALPRFGNFVRDYHMG